MSFKIVIGTKDGKTVQKELSEDLSDSLIGKKIGEKILGNDIGFEGYEFEIRGGSDNSGTPMRADLEGMGKGKILAVSGIGIHRKRRGQKQRKTVCGNVISDKITQINVKVTKEGKAPLTEKPAEQKKEEDKPAENTKAEDKPIENKQAEDKQGKEEPKKPADKKEGDNAKEKEGDN